MKSKSVLMLRLNLDFSNESLWGRHHRCTLLHQRALCYQAGSLSRVAVRFCQRGAGNTSLVRERSLWVHDTGFTGEWQKYHTILLESKQFYRVL